MSALDDELPDELPLGLFAGWEADMLKRFVEVGRRRLELIRLRRRQGGLLWSAQIDEDREVREAWTALEAFRPVDPRSWRGR